MKSNLNLNSLCLIKCVWFSVLSKNCLSKVSFLENMSFVKVSYCNENDVYIHFWNSQFSKLNSVWQVIGTSVYNEKFSKTKSHKKVMPSELSKILLMEFMRRKKNYSELFALKIFLKGHLSLSNIIVETKHPFNFYNMCKGQM